MPTHHKYPESQQALLKIIKVLATESAQILKYGSVLLAIATIGGAALPAGLVPLATGLGINVISSMIERIARGDNVSDDEIVISIKDVIQSSDVENKANNHDIQKEIAHLFRRFDLTNYAIQKGEFNILNSLDEKFSSLGFTLEELRSDMQSLLDQNSQILNTFQNIAENQKLISIGHNSPPFVTYPIELINHKLNEEVNILRKSRFFVEFDKNHYSRSLSEKIIEGDYSWGNNSLRSKALAWCSRILSTENLEEAKKILSHARKLENNSEIEIARAFIYSKEEDKITALKTLARLDLSSARSAALMIIAIQDGFQKAIDWILRTGITISDLDSDGKNSLLMYYLKLNNWDEAFECLNLITDEDFQETPILNHFVARTHLLTTVPLEFRAVVANQLPFELAKFPLASDSVAINSRRSAQKFFVKSSLIAKQLNCPLASTIDDEYALWLELKDPINSEKGRKRLEKILNESKPVLRFVPFCLQFNFPLDLEKVEREIEGQIALHGEITIDAATARFALAFAQKTPEDVANYVAHHIDSLEKFYDPKSLKFLQIEMFSRAGLTKKAIEIKEILLEKGITDAEESFLRRIISESEGNDPIETRKDQFIETNALVDLVILVNELESKGKWNDLSKYGKFLFDRTNSVDDAIRYVVALNNSQKIEELISFVKTNSDFLDQSKKIRMLYCWALFDMGSFLDARSELVKLIKDVDNPNLRALQINIAEALGDINTLLSIVTKVCYESENSNADELLHTAQLALNLGSPLAKDLIFAAAKKGGEDANILLASFFLATTAGLDDDEIYQWFHKATLLSGSDGPIRKMNLKDIVDLNPDWNRREQEIWQQLSKGDLPMFLAAQSLNKSLIDLMLFPSLSNQMENDPRLRGAIPAYSGRRQAITFTLNGKIGLDATALYTLGFLDLVDKVFETLDTIYLPHSTLQWLTEEKQKTAFHQPNQIIKAHQVINLLANHSIKRLTPSTTLDSDLADQIGNELAQLIAEAEKAKDGDIHWLLGPRLFMNLKICSYFHFFPFSDLPFLF